jgi:hypothetical protein
LLGGCFGHGCGGVDVDFGNEICEHDVEFFDVVGAVWPCLKCVVGRALFQYKSTCIRQHCMNSHSLAPKK